MVGVNSNPIIVNASAADSCSGDIEPILWNQTVGRSALVPHYNYYSGYFGFGDYYEDDKGRKGRDHETNNDWFFDEIREKTELNPEEEWMYTSWDRDSRLQKLTSNHHSTMLVGNDSIGALRVNLSEQHRTTICITVRAWIVLYWVISLQTAQAHKPLLTKAVVTIFMPLKKQKNVFV